MRTLYSRVGSSDPMPSGVSHLVQKHTGASSGNGQQECLFRIAKGEKFLADASPATCVTESGILLMVIFVDGDFH